MAQTTTKPRGRPAAAAGPSQQPAARGLDNALALLEVIAGADGVTLSEAAQRAGVAASTAHRILTTLEAHRFLRVDAERDVWMIGVRAFEVGNAFLRDRKVTEIGRPHMIALMETTGETVNVSIREGDALIYVGQIETHNPVRAFQRPGSRAPLHASAAGKVFLAFQSEPSLDDTLYRTGLEGITAGTITSAAELKAQLKTVREQRFAADLEERVAGLVCVAAPIFNEHHDVIASLSVSGPTSRMTGERVLELGPLVRRAAEDVTETVGGRLPVRRAA
ncbi:MAG: IclR family transcriptional regulator [Pseudomonadota bacterium]